ncbi:MAG: hypothetical protein SVW77_00310 [Candidatus Nanohaloarchaea archaeon]|nr:hypothetical protein [Candidatus Nanohaloarchaea archaeon]
MSDGGGEDEDESDIVTFRIDEDHIRQLDDLDEFDSRSEAIRTATGEMQLEWKYERGTADSIDWLIGGYHHEDADVEFRDYVFAALTGIETEQTPAGYISTGRIDIGPRDVYYGFGETLGAAADDLVDTVYTQALERATERYGFEWKD